MRRRRYGSVDRRPSGGWRARYEHEGRTYSRTFAAKADADAWLATQLTDHLRGAWVDPDAGSIPFTAYAERWLAQRHSLRPRTREVYAWLLKRYVIPEFGKLVLVGITTSHVRAWHATVAKAHPATAAKAYRLLRTILAEAVEDRRLVSNPCVVRGAAVEHSLERQIPTVAEVDALAVAMPDRLRLLVLLAAWCGLRRGELLALRRSDCDLAGGALRVERSTHHLNDGRVITGPPKTAAGRRRVHWPPTLTKTIQDHLAAHVGADPDALVFTGEKGGALRPKALQQAWNAARLSVGVTCHLHDLRHLGATLAAATGASTKEIMRRLGHASPAAALRYQHAADDRDATIAAALTQLAPKAPIVSLASRRSLHEPS